MDYKEFVGLVKDDLREAFPGASITDEHVEKLQGQSYEGITVTLEDGRMGVSLDLKPLFEKFSSGMDYGDVIDLITDRLEMGMSQMPEIRTDRLGDYNAMKEHLEKRRSSQQHEKKFGLLINIQSKIAEGKGAGYERWAKVFNLKQMAQVMCFLQENG